MPGYILVKMMYGDDIWHAVTRTQYITGFVGPKGRPIIYHNIIIANHVKLINKQYGNINLKLFPIVIGFLLSAL